MNHIFISHAKAQRRKGTKEQRNKGTKEQRSTDISVWSKYMKTAVIPFHFKYDTNTLVGAR
ncbi:MAG: hypothetical protein ACIWVG_27125, partial [Gloeotrichia echinulata HAB0833]